MGGSLIASEAVLQAVLMQRTKSTGVCIEVALSDAAAYLGLPRSWGLTQAGAAVGGGHAGYRMYACQDGRVAIAALEPHFAAALCGLVGLNFSTMKTMFSPQTHHAVAAWVLAKTSQQLNVLAAQHDIPLHTLPNE